MTKVLIVDDSALIGESFKMALEDSGYSADAVTDGESAIRRIRESAYDLVFMDAGMPGMDGLDAVERIREFDADLPVVLVSGYAPRTVQERSERLGIYRFLNKPVPTETLIAVVREIEGGR